MATFKVTVKRTVVEVLEEEFEVEAENQKEAREQAIIEADEAANNGMAFLTTEPFDADYKVTKVTREASAELNGVNKKFWYTVR